MQKALVFVAVLSGVLLANVALAATYNGTGLWNYSESNPWTNCYGEDPEPPVNGVVGILQTGDSFLIINLEAGFSAIGSISGANYSYSDAFCIDYGVANVNGVITLSSPNNGSGTISWTWYDSYSSYSCSGGHQVNLTKQPQNNPVYNANGQWNFTQSGSWSNCDSFTEPRASGYFRVTQTGNTVTATDDQGVSYTGFINGATYALTRTYPDAGGRTSEVYLVTLNSATSGSGSVEFVWDNDCDDCWGDWDIQVTKASNAQQGSLPGIPLLLLEE